MKLSVIIPSGGFRPSLKETMASATEQMEPGDELIVDVNDIPYGNGARQRTMHRAVGDAILFQDDDDVFAPGMFAVVRAALEAEPTRMHIFRMRYLENREELWLDPSVRIGNVASQMIVVPNIPEKLGVWGDRYEGDFDFITSTCSPEKMGEPVFHEEVLSLVHHPKLKNPVKRTGVVLTYCEGREKNLRRTLSHLATLNESPAGIVVVCDGVPPLKDQITPLDVQWVEIPKHEPGKLEQPRNVGFAKLRDTVFVDHVWFLDSDLIFEADVLERYGAEQDGERILLGPYEWLPEGQTTIDQNLFNDPRWEFFRKHGNGSRLLDAASAIACFGGNIVYPVEAFERVGGFDPSLFHGRCEDGELGLRCVSNGIPVGLVPDARAWHVAHPVNTEQTIERNKIDVPKLYNRYSGWLYPAGFVLSKQDGMRFDWVCPDCSVQMNAHLVWSHSHD